MSEIFLIVAVVCFILSAIQDRVHIPVSLLAVGLVFFAASFLV